MKGVIFTEFVNMVESRFSLKIADTMLQKSAVPSGGAYTSVGTYDQRELQALLQSLSELTGAPRDELVIAFGRGLFERLAQMYPALIAPFTNSFELLSKLDATVHMQVRKLYPDAQLPTFEHQLLAPNTLRLIYRSERGLAPLAEGLILGCIEYFKESIHVERKSGIDDTANHACFLLTKTTPN
jgi:Haem-NO-binding